MKARRTHQAPIAVSWTLRRRPLTDAGVRKVARAALAFGERAGVSVSLVFVDERTLARMHGRWLGDGSPTDVISFDLGADARGPVGELYISVPRAAAQARLHGTSVERELALYIVHGCLHLCGYGDRAPRDRRRMRVAERAVLERLGFEKEPRPFD